MSPYRLLSSALALALVTGALGSGCAAEGEEGPVPARPSPLFAGAGERAIPLPIGHSHAGYMQSRVLGAPHPPDDPRSPYADLFPATRGLETQPYAKAVVLENETSRLVLVKIDAVFPTRALRVHALELLRARYGHELDDGLILQASHTHGSGGRFLPFGPVPELLELEEEKLQPMLVHGLDTFSLDSLSRVAEAIAGAVDDAMTSARPARLGVGSARAEGVSLDRRCQDDWLYGAGAIDDTVTVLRVEDLEGAPIAALFHFAVHGTVYGNTSRLLSADVPGHAEHALAARFDQPVVAFHLQGAAGDVAPDGGGHHGSQAMQRVGEALADVAREAWEQAETRREVTLDVRVDAIAVDPAALGYTSGPFAADGAAQCSVGDGSCSEGASAPEDVRCLSAIVPGTGKRETSLAVARIDDVALLTLPGEPVSATGRALEDAARALGFADALVLGYAQEYDGYLLVDEEDWLSGGYEPTIGTWGWRYGGFLVEESARLLAALARGEREGRRSTVVIPPWPPEERVAETASATPPAVTLDVPPLVERLTEVRFAFVGGDPGLGTPTVTLEREGSDGAFVAVSTNGWLPVDSRHGAELVTFYEATPTSREAPNAPAREHRYEVLYETPRDLAEGRYRFHVEGTARSESGDEAFTLTSSAFMIAPSSALMVDAAARMEGARALVAVTLRYPAHAPAYDASPGNGGHQVGAFRLLDPRFRPPFVPVVEGGAALRSGTLEDESGTHEVGFTFNADAPLDAPYLPGEGPGFVGEGAGAPEGTLHLEAGTLTDAYGNTHAAVTLELR